MVAHGLRKVKGLGNLYGLVKAMDKGLQILRDVAQANRNEVRMHEAFIVSHNHVVEYYRSQSFVARKMQRLRAVQRKEKATRVRQAKAAKAKAKAAAKAMCKALAKAPPLRASLPPPPPDNKASDAIPLMDKKR